MGAEVTTDYGKVSGTETSGTAETRSGNPSTETETRTRGSDGDRGTATRGRETEKEEMVRVPVLKAQTEEEKRAERNAKRRERYAKQKAENGVTVKPRKVNQTKKQEKKVDCTNVQMLLGSVSGLIASRPNMAHWQLTPDETKSIAEPLCNIMSESELFNKVSEHTDAIALVTACFSVFVPRIILTVSMQPKKEKAKHGNIKPIRTDRPEPRQTGKDSEPNTRDSKKPSTNGANDDNTEPWFGTALA